MRSGRTIRRAGTFARFTLFTARNNSATAHGYEYAHDGKDHFVAQDYLGVDKIYYEPTEQGVEKKIKERLEIWRKQFAEKRKSANG